MSKELRALRRIKVVYEHFVKENRDLEPKLMICEKEDFATIKTALKDYEQLKSREDNVLPNDEFIEDLGEHTRDEVAMKLKALEIIKEKRVDVDYLIESVSLEEYNKHIQYCYGSLLTQGEYNLLKEVLL